MYLESAVTFAYLVLGTSTGLEFLSCAHFAGERHNSFMTDNTSNEKLQDSVTGLTDSSCYLIPLGLTDKAQNVLGNPVLGRLPMALDVCPICTSRSIPSIIVLTIEPRFVCSIPIPFFANLQTTFLRVTNKLGWSIVIIVVCNP